ncbi:MAG: UDP-N-acetylmuramoyl-L-alanyl-D-glutamate--2,6-diaminopimelate ligase, partial [Clostridia bacterium]|nr:UDP-N-acetylmuramoyl-L-alanyl-D-glutamate--2,6-diaminopimelate ligase [Clostridia bacterium]
MRLSQITEGINLQGIYNYFNADIADIIIDSRSVKQGSLYVAIKGGKYDGYDYIGQAVENGAAAIISEAYCDCGNVPLLVVSDARKALAIACGNYFDNPAAKMKMVCVVGTNGKSTTSYLISQICRGNGIRCGLIGTMYYDDGEQCYPATLTTPDPWQLNKLLAEMYLKGCTVVAMEVSAHAIYLKKTDNIIFDIGVFTNISQDHLDFFKDMETYAAVKTGFFKEGQARYAVINSDDKYGVELSNILECDKITYGLSNPADIFALDWSGGKSKYIVNDNDDIFEVRSKLYGKFNVSNTLAAIAVADRLGIDRRGIVRALEKTEPPQGRFNVTEHSGVKYVIDFAHTPEGLRNLLEACLDIGSAVTVVFGCGGDRDKSKRPIMGAIAAECAS